MGTRSPAASFELNSPFASKLRAKFSSSRQIIGHMHARSKKLLLTIKSSHNLLIKKITAVLYCLVQHFYSLSSTSLEEIKILNFKKNPQT